MDAAIEQRLQRLEDREVIRKLLVEYGRTLDAGDAAGFASLFATEGEWTGGGHQAKSPARIKEMIERLVEIRGDYGGSNHIMSNFIIDVDKDTATAWSRWMLVVPGPDGKPTIRVAGHYDDVFVRENGDWKFLRRNLTHDLRSESQPPGSPSR